MRSARDFRLSPVRLIIPALLLSLHFAGAQTRDSLKTGERVRLDDTYSNRIIGKLTGWSAEAVFLELSDPDRVVTVQRPLISAVYISRGRMGSTGDGLLIGFAASTILAGLLALSTDADDLGGRGSIFLMFEVVLALPGTLLGGIIGTGVPRDIWEEAVLPVSSSPPSGSGSE